jgi:hypothetical protein
LSQLIESTIPGADALIAWFGRWPSFHDAEILEVSLVRNGRSGLCVHGWSGTSDVDSKGYFVRDHHVVVSFWFENVVDVDLTDFSNQNVIAGLSCEKNEKGFKVTLFPCYGIAGYIDAERLAITFEPGTPRETQTLSE